MARPERFSPGIEVIAGCMYSGKSGRLKYWLSRAEIAKQEVLAFKPAIDNRYSENNIASHDGQEFRAIAVSDPDQIICKVLEKKGITVVGIDEAQFFSNDLVQVAEDLAYRHDMRVILAGLDMDFRARPFGPMPELLARARNIEKLHAVCNVCGEDASRTQRLVDGLPAYIDDPQVLVGAKNAYEARCEPHHQVRIRGESGDIYINPSLVKG